MSKQTDIRDTYSLIRDAYSLDPKSNRAIDERLWELGRIAGIEEAARMAGNDFMLRRDLRAHARKLKRRLK